MMFELLLDVMDRFLNLRDSVFVFEISSLQSSYRCAHLHESHRTLRDGFWGGAVPGTSCQATIAPSLRDISQQALASEGFFYPGGTGRSRVRISKKHRSFPLLTMMPQ